MDAQETPYETRMDCMTPLLPVLDRTKTPGFGDDECNFHLMSRERAVELGFVPGPDAK